MIWPQHSLLVHSFPRHDKTQDAKHGFRPSVVHYIPVWMNYPMPSIINVLVHEN